jgi:hypothetical protein
MLVIGRHGDRRRKTALLVVQEYLLSSKNGQ